MMADSVEQPLVCALFVGESSPLIKSDLLAPHGQRTIQIKAKGGDDAGSAAA